MRRILSWVSWLVVIPVLALASAFALSNKSIVDIDLWPFGLVVQLPLYLVVFGAVIIGVVLGGFVAWLGQGRVRSNLREQAYEGEVARRELTAERDRAKALERELDALKSAQTVSSQTISSRSSSQKPQALTVRPSSSSQKIAS